jgi:hypothetical protein
MCAMPRAPPLPRIKDSDLSLIGKLQKIILTLSDNIFAPQCRLRNRSMLTHQTKHIDDAIFVGTYADNLPTQLRYLPNGQSQPNARSVG